MVPLKKIVKDCCCRVISTRQGFKVRRLHKHFPARFWGRGKNRTTRVTELAAAGVVMPDEDSGVVSIKCRPRIFRIGVSNLLEGASIFRGELYCLFKLSRITHPFACTVGGIAFDVTFWWRPFFDNIFV